MKDAPDKEATVRDVLLETRAELLQIALEHIAVISRNWFGVTAMVQVVLIGGQSVVANGTAEENLHRRTLLVQGREGIQHDIVRLALILPYALGGLPDILGNVLPVLIGKLRGIHEAGNVLCFREIVDDSVRVQGRGKTSGAETSDHKRVRRTQVRHYHLKNLVPVGISPVVKHMRLPVQPRIREIAGSGMEVSGSIRNDDIRPVLERILRNGSAESEGGEDLNHSGRFNVQGVRVKTVLRIHQIATGCGIFVHAHAAAIELDEYLVFSTLADKACCLSAGCRRGIGRRNLE